MGVVLKFVLKNVLEKKLRTILIIFAVMVSSALFFASASLSDIIVKVFETQARSLVGSADILIRPDNNTHFISTHWLSRYEDEIEYITGIVKGVATFRTGSGENLVADLNGIDLPEFKSQNTLILKEGSEDLPFRGRSLIIPSKFAKEQGLKIRDYMDLTINGQKQRLVIRGIAEDKGFMSARGEVTPMLIPRSFLDSLYGANGKVSLCYIKVKNPEEKAALLTEIKTHSRDYVAEEAFPEEMIKTIIQGISSAFMFMLIVALFMSVFIIHSSFKVIVAERLPVIGTLRSIGATKGATNMILLTESYFYGITGGILGCVLGILILYCVTLGIPAFVSGSEAIMGFSPRGLLAAFFIALSMSFFSSLFPILKATRISIKDTIFNIGPGKKNPRKTWKLIFGLFSLLYVFLVPKILPKDIALMGNISTVVFLGFGVVFLIPFITSSFSLVFGGLFRLVFGNEGPIALKNIRDNKSVINSVSLLAVGICSFFLIDSISHCVAIGVVDTYKNADHDIWFTSGGDQSTVRSISSTEGVSGAYGAYEESMVEVDGENMSIQLINSIDTAKFTDYWDFSFKGDSREIFKEFNDGRNIILAKTLMSRLDASVGDVLTLKLEKGKRDYRISGVVDTFWQNGNYALIPENYFKMDTGKSLYDQIFIKTSKDPDEVVKTLKKKFINEDPALITLKKLEEDNMKSNEALFFIQKAFALLTLVIGIFGVVNNLFINFIERKRSIALMRSIGMSKFQSIKILFIEAFSGGIIGGIAGVLAGMLMFSVIPYIFEVTGLPPMSLEATGASVVTFILSGVFITVIASVSPSLKSSNLNIIGALKYE